MPPSRRARKVIRPLQFEPPPLFDVGRLGAALEVDHRSPDTLIRTLPFGIGDTTAGVEK